MTLDSDLLDVFMMEFLGYGNLRSPLWFIGMEEGGGNTVEELQARLRAWDQRGRRHAEDLHDFCQATGHPALLPYATATAPYNRTWCGLIQHLHQRQSQPLASALEYQRTQWLTKGEDNCLLNLMPLPSPNVSTWHYSEWSDLPELQSRATYLKTVAPKRIARLRGVIAKFKPQTVICVGTSYRHYWQELADGLDGTTVEVIPHPAARSSQAPQKSHAEKITHFFASGKPYALLDTAGTLPVYIGYAAKSQLCLEVKQIVAPSMIRFIVENHTELTDALGQPLRWQATGKRGTGGGIFALYYADRTDKTESELAWALRLDPDFWDVAQQIKEG